MWAIRAASRCQQPRGHAYPRSCLLPMSSIYGAAPLEARWISSDSPSTAPKLLKRKVALVAGYMGTGFHGVQLNKDVPTIENELRQAILAVGAMRESNFVDITKIDWSRSSRTDKGVHAGCIVFSGKLLIDEETTVDTTTGRIHGLAESLNAALPPTIRIFSCTRVNKRFNARKNCVLREYEYFMPLSFLKSSFFASSNEQDASAEWNQEEAVEEFCRALRRYEGIHDFHNFTKSRSFFYREHANRSYKRGAKTDRTEENNGEKEHVDAKNGVNVEEETAEDEDEEEQEAGDDGSFTTAEYTDTGSQYTDQKETSRKPLPRHRRSIYSCSGALINDYFGEPYLRIHIVGQAFLLHQIRCMVGGAVAVATKGLSRVQFDAAIETSRIIRIPIAPAEGLVLMSSTFGGKLHTVSLYEDQNTPLASETRGVTHRVLLNEKEDKTMQKFREDVIYKEVVRAWGEMEDLDRWRAYLERSYESNASLDETELLALLEEMWQQRQEQRDRRRSYVRDHRTGETKENEPRGVFPRQFTTKLCVRYAIAPGIYTSDVQRGIARHLRLGFIPVEAEEEELFEYVDEYSVEKFAEEGRNMRMGLTFDGKPSSRKPYVKKPQTE